MASASIGPDRGRRSPDEEARFWPFPLMEEAYSTEDSQKQDDLSPEAGFLADLPLLCDLVDNPEKEKELSRYEKLRLRDLLKDISSQK
jgi:hypothetical protein